MPHFFTSPSSITKETVCLDGPDVNHIKNVLRMKPGEKLDINDGQGNTYHCEIERYEALSLLLNILSSEASDTELPSKIFLFQALPKGDKMELIIQKSVELGVHQIIPVATRRCVVKLDEKKAEKKTQRWNAIAESAAKQCGRSKMPTVSPVMDFSSALEYASRCEYVLIPYELAKGMEETKHLISSVQGGQDIGIFIGPEGGFEEAEVMAAMENGAVPITLGKRILRTETAGLAVLSILMYHLEE